MKAVISCPTCQKKLRIPIDKHIRFNCANCSSLIEANQGKVISSIRMNKSSMGNQKTQFKTLPKKSVKKSIWERPKTIWIIFSAVVFSFISLMIYKEYKAEEWAYERVLKKPSLTKYKSFLRKYPKGPFSSEVTYLRDSTLFKIANDGYVESCLNECDCHNLGKLVEDKITYKLNDASKIYEECLLKRASEMGTFVDLEFYRSKFPEGEYLDSIAFIETQIWADLKTQYATRIQELNIKTKAKKFIEALLDFGQRTQKREVYISFNATLTLEDWGDYPKEARILTDTLLQTANRWNGTNHPLPSTSPPPSIKSGLNDSGEYLQKTIITALQTRLDSVFVPNPFILKTPFNNLTFESAPNIKVNYRVETLTDEYLGQKFPSLYIHTEQKHPYSDSPIEKNKGRFLGYLLATSIQWHLTFNVPDIEIHFEMKDNSRPNAHFSNTYSNSQAYQMMMKSAFENYALKIAEGVGL